MTIYENGDLLKPIGEIQLENQKTICAIEFFGEVPKGKYFLTNLYRKGVHMGVGLTLCEDYPEITSQKERNALWG